MAGPVSSPLFVGRAEELAVLEAAVAGAAEGEGSAVLVSGESGVGKSRLISELAERARAGGATVLLGECVELAEGELPYAPIAGALRSLGEESLLGTAGSQGLLFEQLLEVFTRLGEDAPVVLIVEDLHWADSSTRDFISFLIRNARRERLALIATYRSDELHRRHPLRPFVLELERSGRATRIEVKPFTRAELAEQLSAILGSDPAPDLVDRLLERSDGNAFFVEELLAASGPDAAAPTSLRDALLLRVEALSPATQSVLRLAAVAGRRVDHALLAAIADLPDAELDEALREAVVAYVLVPDKEGTHYSFRHALLRESVYADLIGGERRDLHVKLARTLSAHPERVENSAASTAAELAHHWYAAHELAEALPASIAAGMAAGRIHAYPVALLHYERALEIWDDSATGLPLNRSELGLRAAEAANTAGDPDRAAALVRDVLSRIDEAADPVQAALAHERLGRFLWVAGRGEDALPEHARSVALMPAQPPTEERARVLAAEAAVLMLCSRLDEAIVRCWQAIEVARDVGARAVEANALNTLAATFTGGRNGDVEDAIRCTTEARAIARAEGLFEEVGRSYANGSDALDQAGRVDEAIEVALEGAAEARRHGADRTYGDFLRADVANRLIRRGEWDRAGQMLDAMIERSPTGIVGALIYEARAELLAERGELAAATSDLDAAEEFVSRSASSMWIGPMYETRATIELWAGRPADAAAVIARGFERVGRLEGTEYVFFTAGAHEAGARAAAELALADPGNAELQEAQLEAGRAILARLDGVLALLHGERPPRAVASRAALVAELSRIDGPDPAAWAETAALFDALGDRYARAYCRWREAEALLLTGGGTREAEAAARDANGVALELGARPLAEALGDLAARGRLTLVDELEEGEPADGVQRFGLTPREAEVFALLAGGPTNREIAAELFITEKTASVHVSRILAKVGVRNRAEAAAAAQRLADGAQTR